MKDINKSIIFQGFSTLDIFFSSSKFYLNKNEQERDIFSLSKLRYHLLKTKKILINITNLLRV